MDIRTKDRLIGFTVGVVSFYLLPLLRGKVHETKKEAEVSSMSKEFVLTDKNDTSKKEEAKTVNRVITKYYPKGQIKEVVNEQITSDKRSSEASSIRTDEKIQTEDRSKYSLSTKEVGHTWGIGILLPISTVRDLVNKRVDSNELKYEIIGTINLTDSFSLISSINMISYHIQGGSIGVIKQW